MLLFTFGKWGTLLFGKNSTDQKVDMMVDNIGKEETIKLLQEQLKDAKFGTGNRANIEEQIKRLKTGQEPSYGFFGENKVNLDLEQKKSIQKKNYLEIIRRRKPKEVALKIDADTPSEYFLKVLKILESENIKKVVIETNYKKVN